MPQMAEEGRSGPSSQEILDRLEHFGVRLGLERIRAVLAALGDPHLRLRTVLVAGTNGKGSTAALLASMASAAGYRTGLYTSPHLETPHERIRVDGVSVGEADLARHLWRAVEAGQDVAGVAPTYFEALTAAAYLHFVESEVELAVLEVGLGGRLDATNTAEPELSIVTSIGHDHQEHLGPTLTHIAREKAGILRSDRPALLWTRDRDVEAALGELAEELGARLRNGYRLASWSGLESGGSGRLTTPGGRYHLEPHLEGAHQRENLALAVLAAETLARRGWPLLGRGAIEEGARACRWPGRLERVRLEEGDVILDGAHNQEAVAALRARLVERRETCHLLFGSLRKKRIEAAVDGLLEVVRSVLLTAPPGARARPPEEMLGLFRSRPTRVEVSWREALDRGLERLPTGPLLVCGSLYLVGAVRQELRRRFGMPEPAAEVRTSRMPEPSPARPAAAV